MTIREMRWLLELKQQMNFTKAAERLYLSQPTISAVLFQHENRL